MGGGTQKLDSNQLREALGVNEEAKRTVPSLLEKKPQKGVGWPALNNPPPVTQRAWLVQALRCGHGPLGWAQAYLQSHHFIEKDAGLCKP